MNANIEVGIEGQYVVIKLGDVTVLMSPKHARVIAASLMNKAAKLLDHTNED